MSARPMTYFAKAGWYAALIGLFIGWSICQAASRKSSQDNSRLIALAAARFPNLTKAERVMLWFADAENIDRKSFAFAGPSSNPSDPSNDPAHADKWDAQREIRATLVEWLCIDPQIATLISRKGIAVMGARVVGPLDLSHAQVPFAIALVKCAFPEQISLEATEIPGLELSGSYTGAIFAPYMHIAGSLLLGSDDPQYGHFHASGEVFIENSKVDGDLIFVRGHFQHSAASFYPYQESLKIALDFTNTEVKHDAGLCCGFESDGAVLLEEASIGGNLVLAGGHFKNPGNLAVGASIARIGGSVFLGLEPLGGFDSDGAVEFVGARVGANFIVNPGRFGGGVADRHGLFANSLNVSGAFGWSNVDLQNAAALDLTEASVLVLADDERSWPQPGKLSIDGLTYNSLGLVKDARSRLRWVGFQPEFRSQPYRQLAKVLRANGDDAGAVSVLIAAQDARYAGSPLPVRLWAAFLKITIGYGHRPLLALIWSLVVILVGWGVVWIGRSAGVMRPTWPENPPRLEDDPYEELHPFLYSVDVFFPFVNFHQEHYWWPDAELSGHCFILGRRIRFSGRMMRYYLWGQIAAGWLLSAIFLAGVTGLIRND